MKLQKLLLPGLLIFAHVATVAQNTNYGTNAGNAGYYNTSIGYEAGDVTTAASGTFLGHQAGKNVNFGNFNSFVGAFSGLSTTSGSNNAFMGYASGYSNTNGSNNSFAGAWAGYGNTSGHRNTFFGTQAGYYNSTGVDNAFFGTEAGLSSSTGSSANSFFGSMSGRNNTMGFYNSFFGNESGFSNTTGYRNSFYGHQAGRANTTGTLNAFFGNNAGYYNTSGSQNSFFGKSAGNNNTTGERNTLVGYEAGFASATAAGNTFVGWEAGYYCTESGNTLIGSGAGRYMTTGELNSYVGTSAGSNNTAGSRNVFIGYFAGGASVGSNNVFIGNQAGALSNGSGKLVVHNSSETSSALLYGDFNTRQLGIGTSSLGTYTLTVNGDAFATGLWISSDRRFKEKTKSITQALEKIKQVSGVNYQFRKQSEASGRVFSGGEQLGFIAQDLQKIFPELVKTDDEGYLAVNYQGMIPVLVEAIKELSAEVAYLKTKLTDEPTGEKSERSSVKRAMLKQNYPNPFDQETTIEFMLPENISNATLYIFDLNGKQVATYPQLSAGLGKVSITAAQLTPGLYHYSLVVDGVIIDTRKMLLTDK
ncbi:MAG: tail fiber domain-containing protein [Bacteroidota bacterium]